MKASRHETQADPAKRRTSACKNADKGCTGEAERNGSYGKKCRRCYLDDDNKKRAAKKEAKRRVAKEMTSQTSVET